MNTLQIINHDIIKIMESENNISKSGSYVLTSKCNTGTRCVTIPASFRGRPRGLARAFAKMSPPGRSERKRFDENITKRKRFDENYLKRKKRRPYRDKKRMTKSDFYHCPTKKIHSKWKTSTIHQVHDLTRIFISMIFFEDQAWIFIYK